VSELPLGLSVLVSAITMALNMQTLGAMARMM
jgi:hypothetical protein